MQHQLFLSHDSRDRLYAEALARALALARLTLGQLSVWHSSDNSSTGGLKPGNVWLDEIRTQLGKSRAVVALLTQRSVVRPWILFESGFGAANPECDVIPVCIGIDKLADIPFPLAMYQSYQLADYDSVKRFVEKLLTKYGINFDDEMARPVLAELISKLVKPPTTESGDQPSPPKSLDDAVVDIKTHIDKRIVGLLSQTQAGAQPAAQSAEYSVSIDIREFSRTAEQQYVRITDGSSVQDVLDSVYYMLPKMEPFKYLVEWILRDTSNNINLVLREIGGRIPAVSIFRPGSKWQARKLSKPYSPSDSADVGRWHGKS